MEPTVDQLADELGRTEEPWLRRGLLRACDLEALDITALVRCALKRRREKPEVARRIATGAFLAAKAKQDQPGVFLATKLLAQTHIVMGQPRKALRHLTSVEESGTERDRRHLRLELAQTFSMLARFDEALSAVDDARDGLPRYRNTDFLGRLDIVEGLIHLARGSSADALGAFDQGRKVLARGKKKSVLAGIDINRATALTNLEEYDKAERIYDRCIRNLHRDGNRARALRASYNRAYLRFMRGHFHDALRSFRKLRSQFSAANDLRHTALCDLDEAQISVQMNLPERAAELAARAASVLKKLGIKADVARANIFLAVAKSSLLEFPEARRHLESAEQEFRQLKNGMWWGISLHRLADLDVATGHTGRAVRRATKAVKLLKDCGLRERAGLVEILLAGIELESGEVDDACRRLERLLLEVDDLPMPWLRCEAHHKLAQVCKKRGESRRAVRHALRATRILERHRVAVPPDEYMSAFLTGKARLFRDAVRLVLDLGGRTSGARAFELAEQARSRALLDLLRYQAPVEDPRGDTALQREALRLEREIDGLGSRMPAIDRGTGAADVDRRALAAARREQRLRSCLDKLAKRDPASVALRRGTPPRMQEVRAGLRADETLIEYFVTGDQLVIFVVDAGGLHVERCRVPQKRLEDLLRRVRFQLDRPSVFESYDEHLVHAVERSAHRVLEELHELLLAPIRARLRTHRLIIVPHGELNGLAFHALEHEGVALLAEHEVVQAPSASIFLHCRRKRAPRTNTALLLGVPDEVAPDIRREIEALSKFVPRHRSFIGREASSDVLARYGRRARLIHIAAHARFRPDEPMESGVRLGDRWLTIPQIAALRLQPDLLVLAGCATGRVSVTEGGELFGLVRGFLQAGAASLVTSLWPVPDTEATDFMQGFHKRLAAGAVPAAALRATALDIRARKPHPFYWAPFVLMGCGS